MSYVGEASLGQSIITENGDGSWSLAASKCPQCGDVRLPARKICPNDSTKCESVNLSGRGEIYESVQVSMAPRGFEPPYWVGYVDLEEGVRLFSQIDCAPGENDPSHGERVVLDVRVISSEEEPVYGPVFKRIGFNADN
ncbi:conserved hypothetical protein (plasmid) [Rhodococcus jostii RHA1]|uniref:ChsH2 C-terminal OB-fold domain-containing protein n=1 Tax=Rhodococcus jostii (strain RHA1) TaxID=101510 RepID=Q0RV55_RHOJR|nr:OB-fold domain-containing protein [Rhodococcus jostii]ABH00831.1 conserved hypothetical protein [Rhodococcus jostii RHA1]